MKLMVGAAFIGATLALATLNIAAPAWSSTVAPAAADSDARTLSGRLINFLPVQEPGRAGWMLKKPERSIPLDVSGVRGRISRFWGQRVSIAGRFESRPDGTRVFVAQSITGA